MLLPPQTCPPNLVIVQSQKSDIVTFSIFRAHSAVAEGMKQRYGAAKEAAKQGMKQRHGAAKEAAKKQRNEAEQEAAKEATRRTRRYAMKKSNWDDKEPDYPDGYLYYRIHETWHAILPGRANLPNPARLYYRVNMGAFLRLTEGNDKDRYLAPIVLV